MLGGPRWLWDTIWVIFGNTAPAHSLSDLEQGRALQQAQAARPVGQCLDYVTQQAMGAGGIHGG